MRNGEKDNDSETQRQGLWTLLKDRYAKAAATVAVMAFAAAGCSGVSRDGPPCDGGFCHDADTTDAGQDAGDTGPDGDAGLDGDLDGDQDGDTDPVIPPNTFSNLIDDYVNRELQDRHINDPTDSDSAYSLGGSDTSENANPFTDGTGASIGPNEEFLHRIDSAVFEPLADRTVNDEVTGETYIEKQSIWVRGDNHFDMDTDDIVARLNFVAYSLKFDGPGGEESGITVCSGGLGEGGSCSLPAFSGPEMRRRTISFLGEDWIITGMDAPDVALPDPNQVVNGGQVTLAKESTAGILHPGEALLSDGLRFRFDMAEEHGGVNSMILTILNAEDTVLERDVVQPGQTKTFSVAGTPYSLHLYNLADDGSWADVALLSRVLELEDGQRLNADEGDNPDYVVALGWKNLGASATADRPDALRTIAIYSDDIADLSTSGSRDLEAGDFIPLVQNPRNWRLGYAGLDISSDDLQNLRFEIERSDLEISASRGPMVNGEQIPCTIHAPFLRVSSTEPGPVFSVDRTDNDGVGVLSDDEFIVVLVGWAECGPADSQTLYLNNSVFMRVSPASDDFGVAEVGTPDRYDNVVRYEAIGDGHGTFGEGGAIVFQDANAVEQGSIAGLSDDAIRDLLVSATGDSIIPTSTERPRLYISIAENSGAGTVNYWLLGMSHVGFADHGDPVTDASFSFDSYTDMFQLTSADGEVLYGHPTPNGVNSGTMGIGEFYSPVDATGPVASGMEMVEVGYVSGRGSRLVSITDNRVEFSMSHRLARCVWTITSE